MDFTALLQKINTHWEQQLPFVVYAAPEHTKVNVLLQQDATYYSAKGFTNTGFVFAPFDDKKASFCIPEAFSEKISLEVSMPSVLNTDTPFVKNLAQTKKNTLYMCLKF